MEHVLTVALKTKASSLIRLINHSKILKLLLFEKI